MHSPSPIHRLCSLRRSAFTLIEILCVVVVIGIASAVVLPQMGTHDDQRCAAAARALMADLLYTQNRSIAYATRHYIQFTPSTNSWQVMVDSSATPGTPGSVITHPVNGIPYTIAVGTGSLEGVSIKTVSFDSNNTISFDPMGVPYSYSTAGGNVAMVAGSIVFSAGTHTSTVTVSPYSGQITVQVN